MLFNGARKQVKVLR